MLITVKKLTDETLMQRACEMTSTYHGDMKKSKISLLKIYDCEHSPIRTQLFWIELIGIPTFVSVHFVRHKIGVEHYVSTNREDRGGQKESHRLTPVNHGMLVNAQAIINMSRKRLCRKASPETLAVMQEIKKEIAKIDPNLAIFMVEECKYRGGRCHELQSCGLCNLK